MSVVLNEPLIEVTEPQEGLYSFDSAGHSPLGDGCYFLWINLNAFGADNKTQILSLCYAKLTLLDIYLKASLLESLKHLLYMQFVFHWITWVDEDIIQVGCAEVLQVFKEDVIHILLVGSQTIGKTKGEYFTLVWPVASPERGQLFRGRVYTYSMECLRMSSFVKILAQLSLANVSSNKGSGYWSFLVIALSLW
jgi:hypothetical protein